MLDVASQNKGILVPRMPTAQRIAIASPATGLLVYDTDTNTFWYYDNGWMELGGGGNSLSLSDADNDTKVQVEENPDEDKIRFDTQGSERVVIDETGNVGVGTSNPIEKLDVVGKIFAEDGVKPNYESGWVTVNSQDHVTNIFTTGFLPSRVTVLAQMHDCSLGWIDKYAYIKPAYTSWDDMSTGGHNVYWITSNSVVVHHEGNSIGNNLHDGCSFQRFKVFAWK